MDDLAFRIESTLSETPFAKVYGAGSFSSSSDDDEPRSPVVVKVEQAPQQFLDNEAVIMATLDHPHILKPKTHRSDTDTGSMMVMPLLKHGDLHTLVKHARGLSEHTALYFAGYMLDALQFVNDSSVVHRDFKLENVLIDDNLEPQLIDFGFAEVRKSFMVTPAEVNATAKGTVQYQAPELVEPTRVAQLSGQETFDISKSEVFALGVGLFMMVVGAPPFEIASRNDPLYRWLFFGKRRANFWSKYPVQGVQSVSSEFKDLIERCLTAFPHEGPELKDLVSHPWFSQSVNTEEVKE